MNPSLKGVSSKLGTWGLWRWEGKDENWGALEFLSFTKTMLLSLKGVGKS